MNNIQDLHIEKEVLPLFDYTLNMFSKNIILEILKKPLRSKEEILSKQIIFEGFSKNNKILDSYSYAVSYLLEVHYFLNDFNFEDIPLEKLKYKFFISKKEKLIYRSKLNQLILLFNKLETTYFLRLNLDAFPKSYRNKVKEIIIFLSQFNLKYHEELVRENKLKDNHVIKLSQKILEMKSKNEILIFWNNLFLFEAYLSINKGIVKHNFTFPTISEKGIKLNNFYHPLLENPVTNNFETFNNVVLLNGPNMSGKSTFLKGISLCIYLGHLGFGIPASSGEIALFSNFSIAINRRDDILNGYSHFMTEVVNLKKVVKQATDEGRFFAVFDELFSGTNVEDALEICKTTIHGLCKFKDSLFFISTHIQELKEIENSDVSKCYIECELINEVPTFTYKIKNGWSNIKVGRILFEKEGLNELLN